MQKKKLVEKLATALTASPFWSGASSQLWPPDSITRHFNPTAEFYLHTANIAVLQGVGEGDVVTETGTLAVRVAGEVGAWDKIGIHLG